MTANNCLTLILISTCLLLAHAWSPAAEQDRVTELKGYLNFTGKFEMFSGYL